MNLTDLDVQLSSCLKNKSILISFSCGPDSVFLLDRIRAALPEANILLIYFNHMLREKNELKNEENLLLYYAKQYRCQFRIKKIPVKRLSQKESMSIETAGRYLRRKHLAHYSRLLGCDVICMGHHKDDNIETFFLQLFKGTKRGEGIKKNETIDTTPLIRPLLDLYKDEILDYLTIYQLKFSQDSTNSDSRYKRNHIRKILPDLGKKVNSAYKEHISEFIEYHSLLHKSMDNTLLPYLKKTVKTETTYFIPNELAALDPFTMMYISRVILEDVITRFFEVDDSYITKATVYEFIRTFSLQPGSKISLVGNIDCFKDYDGIYFQKKRGESPLYQWSAYIDYFYAEAYRLKFYHSFLTKGYASNESSCSLSLDGFSEKPVFTLRYPEFQDRFIPFKKRKEIPLNQYFSEKKIRYRERAFQPLLFIDNHLVWVLGGSVSELCHIYPTSENIVHLKIREAT